VYSKFKLLNSKRQVDKRLLESGWIKGLKRQVDKRLIAGFLPINIYII